MSNVVKLAAALPAHTNLNGLDAQVISLVDDPETVRTAVVTYTVQKITSTVKDGIQVPTVQLHRFEPVPGASVSEALLKAAGSRTGAEPLPLEAIEAPEVDTDGAF